MTIIQSKSTDIKISTPTYSLDAAPHHGFGGCVGLNFPFHRLGNESALKENVRLVLGHLCKGFHTDFGIGSVVFLNELQEWHLELITP